MIERLKGIARTALPYAVITGLTLAILDVMLIVTGLFPPTANPGDPDLGWRPAAATGAMFVDRCTDLESGEIVSYSRNDRGVRSGLSSDEILAYEDGPVIAESGDSHSDLCAENARTHFGFTERFLVESGVDALMVAYPSGRYSPLQAYLAYELVLAPYGPQAFILNWYTGNDFNDLLRTDDRPFLARGDGGYEVADPIWYRFDDPEDRPTSRVLNLASLMLERTGVANAWYRVRFLHSMASERGQGLATVAGYLNDIRKSAEPSVGYPEAFAAQMLNQYLFFRRFEGAREESLARAEAVLEIVRREHPDLLLFLGPIPSYLLAYGTQPDSVLVRTMERIGAPLEDAVAQEEELYRWLEAAARRHGWVFVDHLETLRAWNDEGRLYNTFDYHITPIASEIIGRNQSLALLESGIASDSARWQPSKSSSR